MHSVGNDVQHGFWGIQTPSLMKLVQHLNDLGHVGSYRMCTYSFPKAYRTQSRAKRSEFGAQSLIQNLFSWPKPTSETTKLQLRHSEMVMGHNA